MAKKIYQLSPEAKQRKNAYIGKYNKDHYRIFTFKLRTVEDRKLIEKMKNSKMSTCSLVKEALESYLG